MVVPELLLTHQVSLEHLPPVAVVSLHQFLHTLPVAEDQTEVSSSAEGGCPCACLLGVAYLHRKLSRWEVIL